ncbi:MAG TPA: rhamnogalacturonan acetylesterase [Bacillota bacterium]|nr:rhamnogalacturonan acetylesterase [Bacillota bacterium]HPT87504.1 rhamnogalacturonan acetylesterase [Bacillota bacterium]
MIPTEAMNYLNRRTIFIAGDSTAKTYSGEQYPQMGWGQQLPHFLPEGYRIINLAQGGRSSKSFINEGWFDIIKREIKTNDILLIQFGHNDNKPEEYRRTDPFTTYQQYLTEYINLAREKGAVSVLLTSVSRRSVRNGVLFNSHYPYTEAMRELAQQLNVTLIDMTEITMNLYNEVGLEECRKFFVQVPGGLYPGFPEGVDDNTHFNEMGATVMAAIIAQQLKEKGIV